LPLIKTKTKVKKMPHLQNFFVTKKFLLVLFIFALAAGCAAHPLTPVIDGPWWQVASNPDLGEYTSEKQQPVDFAIWQAEDGSWQLWSCIRHTKLGGHTRLFHRWEGKKLTDKDWQPKGVAMLAEPELGEPLGGLQAPHVVKHNGLYWMAYGDWDNICMATSKDGKNFTRLLQSPNSAKIFTEGPGVNNRDPILLYTKQKWHCYYTAFPAKHGYVFCRTSDDLLQWSDSFIVAYGGKAGNNPYSAECPHVVELEKGHYYLFRTQYYGPGAQTMVYYSQNPYNFGIDDDTYYVTKLNVAAPEIIKHNDKYFIAALNPNLDGIRIAKLKWEKQ
jgi:hypothetical protein